MTDSWRTSLTLWGTEGREASCRGEFPCAKTEEIRSRPVHWVNTSESGPHPPVALCSMTEIPEELQQLRDSIDNLDAVLIHIMAERFKLTEKVGHLKASQQLPPADPEREQRQLERLRSLAEASGLDPEFAEELLGFTVAHVIRRHQRIAEQEARQSL